MVWRPTVSSSLQKAQLKPSKRETPSDRVAEALKYLNFDVLDILNLPVPIYDWQ